MTVSRMSKFYIVPMSPERGMGRGQMVRPSLLSSSNLIWSLALGFPCLRIDPNLLLNPHNSRSPWISPPPTPRATQAEELSHSRTYCWMMYLLALPCQKACPQHLEAVQPSNAQVESLAGRADCRAKSVALWSQGTWGLSWLESRFINKGHCFPCSWFSCSAGTGKLIHSPVHCWIQPSACLTREPNQSTWEVV